MSASTAAHGPLKRLFVRDSYTTRKQLPTSRALAQIVPFLDQCTNASGPSSFALRSTQPPVIALATRLLTGAAPPAEHRDLVEWAAQQILPGDLETEGSGHFRWRPTTRPLLSTQTALEVVDRFEGFGVLWAELNMHFLLRDEDGVLPYTAAEVSDPFTCGLSIQAIGGRPASVSYHLRFPWDAPNDRFAALFRRIEKLLKLDSRKLRLCWENADGDWITRKVDFV